MRSRVVRACVVVLFGFAASPVMAQTRAEAVSARDSVFAPDSVSAPESASARDSVHAPDSVSAPESASPRDSVPAPDSVSAPESASAPDSVPAPAPDPARIATLLFMLQNFNEVRVVTNSDKFVRSNAVVSPAGLRLRSASTGISLQARPEEHLVSWAEIESIQVRRGRGAGVLVGAAIGFVIGFSIYYAEELPKAVFSLGEEHASGTPVLVGLVGGAALGWLIDRPGPWRTVYP
jgi:hypothetical protein